ncbi:hypothetical protein EIN_080270 [Entamoeba invadens IP1]|uniref:hypothetical protein n=1 Tax=Entamoeba invadens IP1 TaxID=370355 RepID=UPI0002C3FAD2|nr:hypothetical protein EIN_080270 [Entamoeba invadens IP1]ELP85075.1 hypothetical protein EIN_080270 [Entamoeba invadens IP1]|eukprot:XP_004184421.1 hypothetical protein EIN_080270 [Entamoeba invadens IP1]
MEPIFSSFEMQKVLGYIKTAFHFVEENSQNYVDDVFAKYEIQSDCSKFTVKNIGELSNEIEKAGMVLNKLKEVNGKSHQIFNEIMEFVDTLKGLLEKEDFDVEMIRRSHEKMVDKAVCLETERGKILEAEVERKIEELHKMKDCQLSDLAERRRIWARKKVGKLELQEETFTPQPEREIFTLIETLLGWVNGTKMDIIFDSDKDEVSNTSFISAIKNRKGLYFIVICRNGTVFGNYCDVPIEVGKETADQNLFVFRLKSQKGKVEKYDLLDKTDSTITVWQDNNCLFGIGGANGWIAVHKPKFDTSRCCYLSKWIGVKEDDDVNGTYWTDFHQQRFGVSRIIVVEVI